MICKCRNCTARTIGCHDKCEAYKAFKQYQADLKKEQQAERIGVMRSPSQQKKMHEYVQRYRRITR